MRKGEREQKRDHGKVEAEWRVVQGLRQADQGVGI